MRTPVIDDLLTRLRTEVPDCIAAMAVDVRDGALVASRGAEDAAADVVRELFVHTRAVTCAFRSADDADPQEVIMLSAGRAYVCQALKQHPGIVAAAVSAHTANLGMLLAVMRREVAAVEGDA
ncbi:MAG: hypothetical protein JO197_06905 [Acidobacteria bacterium]|nr:hypothetical protein [Acidobacteriota bacterium]MBV9477583.1 hypothetical protein [Acidobacteriota bacterium]